MIFTQRFYIGVGLGRVVVPGVYAFWVFKVKHGYFISKNSSW